MSSFFHTCPKKKRKNKKKKEKRKKDQFRLLCPFHTPSLQGQQIVGRQVGRQVLGGRKIGTMHQVPTQSRRHKPQVWMRKDGGRFHRSSLAPPSLTRQPNKTLSRSRKAFRLLSQQESNRLLTCVVGGVAEDPDSWPLPLRFC